MDVTPLDSTATHLNVSPTPYRPDPASPGPSFFTVILYVLEPLSRANVSPFSPSVSVKGSIPPCEPYAFWCFIVMPHVGAASAGPADSPVTPAAKAPSRRQRPRR